MSYCPGAGPSETLKSILEALPILKLWIEIRSIGVAMFDDIEVLSVTHGARTEPVDSFLESG
jgi:hypothetical protein